MTTYAGNWSSAIAFELDVQSWPRSETQLLKAADEAQYDEFGSSVSLSADGLTMAVGAMYDDDPMVNAGSVYVFEYENSVFVQKTKLTIGNATAEDLFGSVVKISGDGNTIFVSALGEDTIASNAGAVYVFVRSGNSWTQQSMLTAADADVDASFGFSLDCSHDGNRVIIGIDQSGIIGAAYIFHRTGSTWSQQAKIVPSDGANDDQFGYAVAMSYDGTKAAISSPKHNSSMRGAVYYLTYSVADGWVNRFKLTPPSGGSYNNCFFGEGLNASSDFSYMVVGAPGKDTGKGEALLYVRSSYIWSLVTTLLPADYSGNSDFGYVVDINDLGDCITVSSTIDHGAVYVFVKLNETWSQQEKLVGTNTSTSTYFGVSHSLSSDGERLVTGTDNIVTGLTSAGAVHVFN